MPRYAATSAPKSARATPSSAIQMKNMAAASCQRSHCHSGAEAALPEASHPETTITPASRGAQTRRFAPHQ